MIAATTTLALSTAAAQANDLSWVGSTEYAIEAETFSVDVGVEYGVGNFTFAPLLTMDDAGDNFDFTGAELEVGYAVSANVTVFGRIEADEDFDYDEAVVGASFKF